MGLKFNLYAYVFRHTAITVALDKGIPVSYVTMVAGTSIEMRSFRSTITTVIATRTETS